jgi:tetratricopeptide (TPR) repeat protein
MIVKDESKIITRLFDSVLSIIDCYCICDTGSSDNTIQIIEEYFQNKGVPGKIVKEPFQDFAYNRNYALQACNGMSDYVLLLDADMLLEINNFNKQSVLNYDTITFFQGNTSFFYQNIRIVKNNGLYSYSGVTHEYMNCPPQNRNLLADRNSIFIKDIGDGGSKSKKYERDIQLLLNDIKLNPNNTRSYFYLANSYCDSNNFSEALIYYAKRIELGGWEQEVWYSYYKSGLCYKYMGEIEKAISTWLMGYDFYPERLEGLCEIIEYYRLKSKYKLCMEFLRIAFNILNLKLNRENYLFLYNDTYTYKLFFEYTIVAAYVGIKNINYETVQVLNNSDNYTITNNLLQNMKFYKFILNKTKVITYNDTKNILIDNKPLEFYSSSACIIKKDNTYLMNVRYVNYRIHNTGSYFLNGDKNVISTNIFVELSGDNFKVTRGKMFNLHMVNRLYIGIEDIKIFTDIETDKILFIGTGYHLNNTIGIVIGEYNIENDELISREIKQNFKNSTCEKNWVFFEYKNSTHVVYSWYPLHICKIDNDTNMLNIVEKKEMPLIFSHCRGSTCGFKLENNETWFVIHLVSYEIPRHYYHMIVVFDNDMNLKSYSAPFKFEGEPIEFCLGLIVEKEQVIMSYSTWDRSTKIAIHDKSYIDSLLVYK